LILCFQSLECEEEELKRFLKRNQKSPNNLKGNQLNESLERRNKEGSSSHKLRQEHEFMMKKDTMI